MRKDEDVVSEDLLRRWERVLAIESGQIVRQVAKVRRSCQVRRWNHIDPRIAEIHPIAEVGLRRRSRRGVDRREAEGPLLDQEELTWATDLDQFAVDPIDRQRTLEDRGESGALAAAGHVG